MKRKHALLPTILALSIGIFPSLVLSQEAGLPANPVGDGAAQNLLSRIDALGDVSVNKVTVEMSFTQPLDHQNPEAGTFDQRVVLIHKGFEKPLVLWLEGYAWKDDGEQEITANQLSVEHRYFGYDTSPFDGLLTAAREPTFKFCAPEGTEPVFDPEAMQDIHQWITTEASNMIFIYGEVDPWSASAVQLAGKTNSLKMVKKGSDHTTRIKDFEGEEKDRILDALQEWLHVEVERDLK